MSVIIALCGKPGCGKSTLSKQIAEEFKAVPFSADLFMRKLYGEIPDRKLFKEKLFAVKDLIYEVSNSVIKYNTVVFDFGFWKKAEREKLKERFEGHTILFVYLKMDDDEIYKRVEERNENLSKEEYFIGRDTFDELAGMFEEPDEEEDVIVYRDMEQLRVAMKNCKE